MFKKETLKKEDKRIFLTIFLIVILTIIYLLVKIFNPEMGEKELAIDSSILTSNDKNQYATDQSTKETYVTLQPSQPEVGQPLQAVIVNPGTEKEWYYTWEVGTAKKGTTESTYTPIKTDNEHFITVTATSASGKVCTASVYMSKLPVFYIDSDEKVGETYTTGTIKMQGNSVYSKEEQLYQGNLSIKLRGNSTKNLPKHPYHIKLENKTDLFGMGANKHWVLLANAIDHTLIRNKLLYDFSNDLGASYAAESENVVLVLNGEYQGVYQLCEHIRVAKERVDIYNWEDLAEDAAKEIAKAENREKKYEEAFEDALVENMSWLSSPYTFTYENKTYTMTDYVTIPERTGGFLLEMDFYHSYSKDPGSIPTNFLQPFYFNTPETAGTNNELKTYAKDYIQTFEYALHSSDFVYHDNDIHYEAVPGRFDWEKGWSYTTKETSFHASAYDGMHYSELFDLNSLVNNFLVCEFSVNWDSMKNSVFITKDLDSPAILGPCWDYDWAFGNKNMYEIDTYFTDIWQTTNEYFTNEQCYQALQWNRFLIRDPYFLYQVYQKYQEIRPTLLEDIIKKGGTLDTYHQDLSEAARANDMKWSSTYHAYHGENFESSYLSLKNFIRDRINWLDEQFTDFDTFVASLGYYQKSSEITFSDVTYAEDGSVAITANTSNTNATMMSFQVNGTSFFTEAIKNGKATVLVPKDVLTDKEKNIVQVRISNADGTYISTTTNEKNADTKVALSNYQTF